MNDENDDPMVLHAGDDNDDGWDDNDDGGDDNEEEVIHNEDEEYVDDTENDEDDRYSNTAADNDAYDDDGNNEAIGVDVDSIAGDDGDNEQRSG